MAKRRPYKRYSNNFPRRRRGWRSFNPLTWLPSSNPISIPRQLPPLNLQRCLVYINIIFYLYQIITAVQFTPQLNSLLRTKGYNGPYLPPSFILKRNLSGSPPITISGSTTPPPPNLHRLMDPRTHKRFFAPPIVASSMGPLTTDFIHQERLTAKQPHRLVTSGFLHGSLLHLVANASALWNLPRWVAIAARRRLYLATYLASIVAGHLLHSHLEGNVPCLGASGGICGMYGLTFVLLRRMKRFRASRAVFRNMVFLVLLGVVDKRISNAGHVGGFLGGVAMGYLFGPRYRKSYAAKNKTWFMDDSEREVRRVMGPDLVEGCGYWRVEYLWGALGLGMLWKKELRMVPVMIAKSLWNPGVLSGVGLRAV